METKDAIFVMNDGQRKILPVDTNEVFRWCYLRGKDLREWAWMVCVHRAWHVKHGILRDINIQ